MKFSRQICHIWILLVHCLWRNVLGIVCSETIEGVFNLEGQISAPNFPESYRRISTFYTCTYTLRNRNDTALSLVFNDFHLDDNPTAGLHNGTRDYLQINLNNGQTPLVYVGIHRPNVIYTFVDEVTITLGVQANQQDVYSGLRTFSAQYSFITRQEMTRLEAVYTDSRTVIPDIPSGQGDVAYTVLAPMGYISGFYSALEIDFIWYIEAESHMKILFVIKEFSKTDVDDTSSLEIRGGLTSADVPLYVVRMAPTNYMYHVQSPQNALYVRWQGRTAVDASFEAYFTFFIEAGSGMQCPGNYFSCSNDHCVNQQLTCNMRDNCGDNSDEDTSTVCQDPPRSRPCEPSPCLHSSTCIVFGSNFLCLCSGNYEGVRCDVRKSRTTTSLLCSSECINGGVCINNVCQCPDQFFGDLCQFRNGSNSDFTDLQHTSIMIGAFVGAVCLLSVCWLIAMARKRYQDEPAPGTGHHHRIVSVHTLEEAGLRRNTTITDNQDIPPEYSVACRRDSRRGSRRGSSLGSFAKRYRPSIDSMGPLSPPPAYEVVTGAIDMENYDGITFRIPEEERGNLPDVVHGDQTSAPAQPAQTPPAEQQTTVHHETEIHEEPQSTTVEPAAAPSSDTTAPQDTLV